MFKNGFVFAFTSNAVSLATAGGKRDLTRANEFEVVGLLCLRMLENKQLPVTLADVSRLVDIRNSDTRSEKRIQAIQVRRVVKRMCDRFKLPIASTSKGYGGGWAFANTREIRVIVDDKDGDPALLRQVLGLDQRHVLWDDSLPVDIPNANEIERIARQAVAIQVIHGHVTASAAGLRSHQVDPDSWPEQELLTLLSATLALISPREEAVVELGSLRSRIKRLIDDRRSDRQKEVATTYSAKLKHYRMVDGDEAQEVLRITSSMISDPDLRLAVLSNEARALRRSGDLETAATIMVRIEEDCHKSVYGYHDSVISSSISIEKAWIAYLSGDDQSTYDRCEAKLKEFSSNISVGRYDTRLLLEYHLLAALCARRRAVLAPSGDTSEPLTWVRRAFQHFNVALRQCLLTEDRELQVHTLGTLGDAIWDLGSKGLISKAIDTKNTYGFDDRKIVAVVALRIIGAAMLIARLGGANSGHHYALAYLLMILGESSLGDSDFRAHDFRYEGVLLTLETIRGVATQSLAVPVLSPEARARISYGLAILENRSGMEKEASKRLSELSREYPNRVSHRLKQRIEKTLSKWSDSAEEQGFMLSP